MIISILAGVDGGATRTRVALADLTGRILGIGKSGPSNYGSVSKHKIQSHLEGAFRQAFRHANISPVPVNMLFIGMAGVISRADKEAIRQIIEESHFINSTRVYVDHDIRISLAGGLAGKEGIALIVGTGSSCYGRTSEGHDWMAGGWGHVLDDRGSAYELARRGLSAVMRAEDGRGPKTNLTDIFADKLKIEQVHEIMHRVYVDGPSGGPMSKEDIASLAPLVTKAAHNSDEVALQIIGEEINELVLMVKTVGKYLSFSSSPVPLTVSGGTVNGSPLIKKELYNNLKSSVPGIEIVEPTLTPLQGSVLLALKSGGVDIDTAVIANLKEASSMKLKHQQINRK